MSTYQAHPSADRAYFCLPEAGNMLAFGGSLEAADLLLERLQTEACVDHPAQHQPGTAYLL